MYCSMTGHASPRKNPQSTNTVFHASEPAAESSPKRQSGIRVTPAGMEMSERKMGIIRPKNTALPP